MSFAPLSSAPNRYNLRYLETKQIKQGHRTVMSEFDPLLEDGSLERGLIAAAKSRQFNGCVVIVHTMWNQNFVLPIVKKCKEFLETQAKIEVELLEVYNFFLESIQSLFITNFPLLMLLILSEY